MEMKKDYDKNMHIKNSNDDLLERGKYERLCNETYRRSWMN